MNSKLSDIAEMKFLLILGVVLIHCNLKFAYPAEAADSNVGIQITNFISTIVCACCVPCFYLISGRLFFNGVRNFSFQLYCDKLKRRLKTLLIPYLIWNLFCAALLFVKFKVFHMSGLDIYTDNGINFPYFLKGFWSIDAADSYPFAFAFWFIRNLMVFILLTPLIWLIIRRNVTFGIFCLVYLVWDINFYGIEWFVLGAYSANKKFPKIPVNFAKLLPAAASVIFWGACLLSLSYPDWSKFSRILQIVSAWYLLQFLADKVTINRFLLSATFMIYAVHQCMCSMVRDFWVRLLGCETFLQPLAAYLLSFTTLVFISLSAYYLLKKTSPATLAVITGGR